METRSLQPLLHVHAQEGCSVCVCVCLCCFSFQISSFAMTTPVDGLWIDMNEPSNFCNGGCFRKSRRSSMGAGFDLYNPPYNLNNQDKGYSLNHKTLDVFAIQYGGHFFFDTHNLYGKSVKTFLLVH